MEVKQFGFCAILLKCIAGFAANPLPSFFGLDKEPYGIFWIYSLTKTNRTSHYLLYNNFCTSWSSTWNKFSFWTLRNGTKYLLLFINLIRKPARAKWSHSKKTSEWLGDRSIRTCGSKVFRHQVIKFHIVLPKRKS